MDIPSYLLGKKAGGGGDVNLQNKSVTITSNGNSTVRPDSGYDGLSSVGITTDVVPSLQNKQVSVTQNGTSSVSADSNYDGLGTVEINTNVAPNLQSKQVTITENTTTNIIPDTGYDGLQSVNVITNVPTGGTTTVRNLTELNNEVQNCIDSFLNYASTRAEEYYSYTTQSVTLYTPNINNKIYAIRKRTNGKYQIMWFPETLITIYSSDTEFLTQHITNKNISTNTFINNTNYYTIPHTPQTYLSSEFNTLEEAINAIQSNNTVYTATTEYNSWGATRYSQDYFLPFCNWYIRNSNDGIEESQRISTNETIEVIS